MSKLGIRVAPKQVTFSIVENNNEQVINIESLKVPAALSAPETLKYIRYNILDIIREYDVEHAGIRTIESSSQRRSIERIQIEGVIQEAFASSPVKDYYVGQISNISKRAKIRRTDFKKYIDGDLDYERIENWKDLSREQREATLCALGA